MDHAAADELKLYIDNDGELYRRQTTPILKNLATKMARGEYDHDKAAKLFGYLVESGAKKYARDEGGGSLPWHKMFPPDVRRKVAAELADYFLAEAKLGAYDSMLPKKYQSSAVTATPATRTARRSKSKADMEQEIRAAVGPTRSPRLVRARQRANFGRPPG